MITVNFGVVDFPYDYGSPKGKTTFEVAQELQNRYKLFTGFYKIEQDKIASIVGQVLAMSFVNSVQHGRSLNNEFSLDEINILYRDFLNAEKITLTGVPGVPTLAALLGVNSRLKKERGKRRPSFIDGGLQYSSFRAWMTSDG